MTKRLFLVLFGAWCGAAFAALPSEITVTLKPAHDVYVEGERIRVVVDVANASPDVIDCRGTSSPAPRRRSGAGSRSACRRG